MSLTKDDLCFYNEFKKKELIEVKISSWSGPGDGVMHLRGISYMEYCRFMNAAIQIQNQRAMGSFTEEANFENLQRAEHYLMKASICDPAGENIFKSDKDFNNFLNNLDIDSANEILFHIKKMNNFSGSFANQEEAEKIHKKK